jgi:putative endonuclease
MHYVYIIYSKSLNGIYKGTTSDLKQRINEHNSGKAKSTKSGKLWTLVYCEAFINKSDALIEEVFLRSGKGKERKESSIC